MRMNRIQRIVGGTVVLPDQVIIADVVIVNGLIQGIYPNGDVPIEFLSADVELIDAQQLYVMPGMIDMHSDAIEREIQPRPNTSFPLSMSFYELEKKLAVSGITTIYHSVSLADGVGVRDNEKVLEIVDSIRMHQNRRTMIRHKVHLRYELTNLRGLDSLKQLVREKRIDLLSYMDHTPGQGQFHAPGAYEEYMMKAHGYSGQDAVEMIEQIKQWQKQVNWPELKLIAAEAVQNGISVASHDDDSIEKIDQHREYHISISEFPIHLEAAEYARKQGLFVCVGSPNVVRGHSHSNNMKAIDAIRVGAVDILCSDYMPTSMLPAVMKLLSHGIPMSDAVNMVSLEPARALGIAQEVGSITVGKQADLILVEVYHDYPIVRNTIVSGNMVYQSGFYQNQLIEEPAHAYT